MIKISGQHEEHIDADEAASYSWDSGMEQHDEQRGVQQHRSPDEFPAEFLSNFARRIEKEPVLFVKM